MDSTGPPETQITNAAHRKVSIQDVGTDVGDTTDGLNEALVEPAHVILFGTLVFGCIQRSIGVF